MLTRLIDELDSKKLESLTEVPTSRRGLLAGGLTIAMGAAAGVANAQSRGMGRPSLGGAKPPNGIGGITGTSTFNNGNGSQTGAGHVAFTRSWTDTKKKLLRRATFGARPSDLAEIEALGYNGYLEKQLNFEAIDDSASDAEVSSACPLMGQSAAQLNAINNPRWLPLTQFTEAMILRCANSKRQLYYRMAEFWLDHFYVTVPAIKESTFMDYGRNLVMSDSLSSFRTLLRKSANHGAMMVYLDNEHSSGNMLNVNYARELLELHTVGVEGGYTEADIYEVARIMTGWSVYKDADFGPQKEVFRFQPGWKVPGSRTVMGRTFTESGKAQGDALLDWLAAHPATIRYITDKLCEYFLGHNVTPQILQAVGNVWGAEGDIKAVMRIILSEQNIARSRPIYKRPFYLMVGAYRQTETRLTNAGFFIGYLKTLGQDYSQHIQPDGFPNGFSNWAGAIVMRFHVLARASAGHGGWGIDDFRAEYQALPDDAARMSFINEKFFLGELPVSDQIWIRRYMKRGVRARETLTIALSSPSYQWH